MEKKFKSFKSILIEAKSQRDIINEVEKILEPLLTDIILERNLADCAVWLKGAIVEIEKDIEYSKTKGMPYVRITELRDSFKEHLENISKIMVKEPEKI